MGSISYDDAGRLIRVHIDGTLVATYTYNAQNQRVRKETPAGTIIYHYDLAGNLISETNQAGAVVKDYLWQDGQPVAQITTAGTETISYLHTDHLQTPRQASDQNGMVVWRWDDADAFGAAPANEDPDSDGNLVKVNLRFPGQYFDEETGLHYNWNRYYSPETGRYITSDPIGLQGGLNVYVYSKSNPVRFIDPHGLQVAGTLTCLRGGICIPGGIFEDEFGDETRLLKAVGRATKQCITCIVRCEKEVLIGEVVSRLSQAALKEIAKNLALKLAKKAIPFYGQVSTAVSIQQGVACFGECDPT